MEISQPLLQLSVFRLRILKSLSAALVLGVPLVPVGEVIKNGLVAWPVIEGWRPGLAWRPEYEAHTRYYIRTTWLGNACVRLYFVAPRVKFVLTSQQLLCTCHIYVL